jgi:Holliday junction resolvase RusA-like endonuclease
MTQFFFFPGVTPISANTFYGLNQKSGRKFITKKGREFQKQIRDAITDQMKERKIFGPIAVHYSFGYTDERVRDVDNGVKHFTDCIKGILFEDDSLIQTLEAWKVNKCADPFIIVIVTPTEKVYSKHFIQYVTDTFGKDEDHKEDLKRINETCKEKGTKRTPRKQLKTPKKKKKVSEAVSYSDRMFFANDLGVFL